MAEQASSRPWEQATALTHLLVLQQAAISFGARGRKKVMAGIRAYFGPPKGAAKPNSKKSRAAIQGANALCRAYPASTAALASLVD